MRASSRPVYFLNVTCQDAGVGVDLSRVEPDPSEGASVLEVPVATREISASTHVARGRLLDRVVTLERRFLGDDLLIGDKERDKRTDKLDDARRAVDQWDYAEVLAPVLGEVRGEALLVYPGEAELPRFDLRACLREAVRTGDLSLERKREVVCLPTWPDTMESLSRHLLALCQHGLPLLDPSNVTILLGPPPPDDFLESLTSVPKDEVSSVFLSLPKEVEALAWRAMLRAELILRAQAAGHHAVAEATRQSLVSAPASPGGALFLVAHQDEAGAHLYDGPVSPVEVYHRLGQACSGEVPYSSVDLSVCGADAPGNFATVFGALGARVVLTRGRFGYEAGMLHRLLHIVEQMRQGCRLSLPEMHDRIWESTRE